MSEVKERALVNYLEDQQRRSYSYYYRGVDVGFEHVIPPGQHTIISFNGGARVLVMAPEDKCVALRVEDAGVKLLRMTVEEEGE